MKFYYLQDPNGYHSQLFSTKKAALDWIKNANAIDDWDNEVFTKYDIQVLHIPQLTKKHILFAMHELSTVVGSTINIPELD
jgi:hypothetical protein